MANIVLDKIFPNDIKRLIMSYNLPNKEKEKEKFSEVLKEIECVDRCAMTCSPAIAPVDWNCMNKVSKLSPVTFCQKCALQTYYHNYNRIQDIYWREADSYRDVGRYIDYHKLLKPKFKILNELHNDLIMFFIKKYKFQCRTVFNFSSNNGFVMYHKDSTSCGRECYKNMFTK